MFKGEILAKLKGNMEKRVDNIRQAGKTEADVVKSSVDDLFSLKPIPAVVDLVNKTGSNLGGIVKTQAEITREWVK